MSTSDTPPSILPTLSQEIPSLEISRFVGSTFPISKITSRDGSSKEITEEGKVVNLIYGIENSERATVLEVQRNYEQALKNGNFEILFSAFGRKKISGSYKIQSVYKTFGDIDITSQYQHMKPKSYFRFSLASQAKNIDSVILIKRI